MPVHRDVEFSNERPAPSEADIRGAEELLGVRLPPPYLDLLQVAHGAETDAETALPDRPLPVCFGTWHSLPEALAERESYEDAYFIDELPRLFLPLAVTGGEDDVLLLRLDEAYGEVWAWLSGRPPGWHRPTEDVLLRLAADLNAYLDSLLPAPPHEDA